MDTESEKPERKQYVVEVRRATPRSVFDALASSLERGALRLPLHSTDEYTRRMVEFFIDLGRKWGYEPWKEYMSIDIPWLLYLPDKDILELALEHENSRNVNDILEDELPKLTHLKAHLKAVIYYPPAGSVETDLKMIAEDIANQDISAENEKWLIITGSGDVADRKEWGTLTLRAFEIDSKGAITDIGQKEFETKEIAEHP